MNDWQQRVIALAGMSLSAAAVQKIARSGSLYPESITDTLVHSVLQQSPDSIEQVYGGLVNLQPGLQTFVRQIGSSSQKDVEVTRYLIGMLHLSRRLLKEPKVLDELGQRISQIKRQKEEFGFEQYRILESMAGKPEVLKSDANQHHIRALLLAGLRSAILWNQVGGKRRHFIFSRKQMLKAAQQLLQIA